MRLVHKQPVHTQLLKGDDVILLILGKQLFQPGFQRFARLFQLLNREPLAVLVLGLLDALGDLVDLLLDDALLALGGNRDVLKLAVTDDDRVVIARGDARAELLAVRLFKVLLGRHEDVRAGIQSQELGCPLLRQVIGHDEHGFVAQPQPLALHRSRCHFVCLPCPYLVCKQRIPAVEHMRDGIPLVLAQADFRVHAGKDDVAAVVFAGPSRIEQFVVLLHQIVTALWILPDPVLKGVLDSLLLLLGERRLALVEHALRAAVRILHRVVDAHVAQVQRVLQYPEAVRPVRAIGHVDRDVAHTGS